jgi:proline iminopeptidase
MRVQVGDVRLFFDVEGAKLVPDGPVMRERPTLILLHGGPGFDHSGFKPLFSELSDAVQLVYLDHRGNGRRIVLGQSFGGMVAMAYATRHPDHPAKLILSSTSARMRLDRVLDVFERLGGEEARAAASAYWSNPGKETLPDYARICFPLYSRTPQDPDGPRRTVWNFDVMFDFGRGEDRTMNFLPDLPKLRCPTLVMVGEDDPITPVGDAEDMAAALPAGLAQLRRFPDCRHGVFRDSPEEGLDAIRQFILSE